MPKSPVRNNHHFSVAAKPQSFEWANVSLRIEELYPSERKPVEEGGFICNCPDTARVIDGYPDFDKMLKATTFTRVKAAHVHWDQVAFEHGTTPLCLSGGFGASKTFIACLKILRLAGMYPQNRFVIARKVAKELALTTQATFFKICQPSMYDTTKGGRRADSENYLRLSGSQSEVLWLHLEQNDIDKVIRGLEVNGFVLDQAEEIEEDVFDTLDTRLGRWDKASVPDAIVEQHGGIEKWPWKNPETKRPSPPSYGMILVNPDAETHWVYKRFHPKSREWQETYSKQGYRMIEMHSYENKFLPDENLEKMLHKDASWKRRFVFAQWGIPEGQIHNVRKDSVIAGTQAVADYIINRCRLHRTLDHGNSAPTCCGWSGVDQEGNTFFYREYYKPDPLGEILISGHRKRITQMSRAERYVTNLADPSMFFRVQQKHGGLCSFADDYSDRNRLHGFSPEDAIDWMAADNNEEGTRNLINEYLRPQGTGQIHRGSVAREVGGLMVEPGQELPRAHPITGQFGYWPKLYFIAKSEEYPEGCDFILRETRAQRYENAGTDLGKPVFSDDRQDGIPDHGYDVVRYFMASRAALPVAAPSRYGRKSYNGIREKAVRLLKTRGAMRFRG